MTRFLIGILLIVCVAGVALALAGDPGAASLSWLGWRIDTSAAAATVGIAVITLMATLIWKAVIWFIEAPSRAAKSRAEARRREGAECLSRGFVAAAAGAGGDARRLALKAADYTDDQPILVRLLAAQAAEAAGDEAAAQQAYMAMLGFPDLRLVGHRGLMLAAQRRGDSAEAARQAEAAYGMTKTSRWAWRALLEARLAAGEWDQALALAKEALDRKLVSPAVAERARAALLAASAAWREESQEPKSGARKARDGEAATELALQSAKLRPDFAPGVVLAARGLAQEGKTARAAQILEAAWKLKPHPALWLAYRDLIQTETPKARARRFGLLVEQNPNHPESSLVRVEQALLEGDIDAANRAAANLDHPEASARVCALMARLALASRNADGARAWAARALVASIEPDWSDIGPDGRAFAYGAADWSRLVSAYAETGELIHPRLERGERVLNELPDLPVAYNPSAAFFASERDGDFAPPLPDDPGFDDDDALLSAPRGPQPTPVRRRRPTR